MSVKNLIHETATLPINKLSPHPMNARQGNVALIKASLKELGQYRSIVVNQGTMTGRPFEILAGHHVVKARADLGEVDVMVDLVDVDDETGKKIMIMDNRSNDVAVYDALLQLELLESLGDLDGTGYDPGDLDAMRALHEDHSWEISDLQDTLDEADEDGWPEIRVKVAPELHRKFLAVPGADDTARVVDLIESYRDPFPEG